MAYLGSCRLRTGVTCINMLTPDWFQDGAAAVAAAQQDEKLKGPS
jgi:hypothetical protein